MSRSGLWIVAAGVAGFVAAITYWVIALAVADSNRADMVAPERVTGFIQAVIDANRANYTQNVVDKLHNQGVVEALEHWKEEKGLPLPAQFLLESGRLVAQKDLKLSFRLASLTPIYVWNGPNSDFERRGLEAVVKTRINPIPGFISRPGSGIFKVFTLTGRSLKAACPVTIITPTVRAVTIQLNDIMGGVIVTIPITEMP